MKGLLKLALLILPFFSFGQNKGLSPVGKTQQESNGQTYAVVIGISDYQDEAIPDLYFAHRDAQIFATFLQSKAGGQVPIENMKVLINEKATNAKMVAALDWLIDQAQEGDACVIYFSGHGDVETKTRRQLGFLLPWDSPAQAYMAGAYPLFYLEEVIATLSLDQKADVTMIADACRAGKLAGSAINGAQLTSVNLSQQFAKEVKILSCQANEYSQESEKWGGGRGIFSYHLVDGLYGLADKNQDYKVNLLEIGRYLEDRVMEDVAPATQIPLTVGPKSRILSTVDPPLLARVKKQELDDQSMLAFTDVNAESTEKEALLSSLSTHAQRLFQAFQQALKDQEHIQTLDSLYTLITEEEDLASLMPSIQRDLSTALQDEVQQALNALIHDDPYERNNFMFNPANYNHYPEYVQRSIELLEPDHYTIPALKAKKKFFEGYNIIRVLSESDAFDKPTRDSLRVVASGYFDQAIALQPDAAYLYFGKIFLYSYRTPSMIDSLLFYQKKVSTLSPQWILPYLSLSTEYTYNIKDYQNAEVQLQKAQQIKPNAYVVLEYMTWLYQTLGEYDKALAIAQQMIDTKPDLFNGYGNVGCVYFQKLNFPESEKWLKKSLDIYDNPTNFVPQYYSYVLMSLGRAEEARRFFQHYIQHEETPYWMKAKLHLWYAKALLNFTTDWETAIQHLNKSLKRQHAYHFIAEVKTLQAKAKIHQQKWSEAKALLTEALAFEPLKVNAFMLGYVLLGEVEAQAGNLKQAQDLFKKGMQYPGNLLYEEESRYRYGLFLLQQGAQDEAFQQFQRCEEISEGHGFLGPYGKALVFARQEEADKAIDALAKALDRFYPYPQKILQEPAFESLRSIPEFEALIRQ